jgi:DNA-binding transcriptional LysR family regulator
MPELRLGYHGSLDLPRAVLHAAGLVDGEGELVEYDVRDPFTPLRSGWTDLMITEFRPAEPDLRYTAPIAADARAVLLATGHPLAGRKAVSVEEVADYPVFRRPAGMPAEMWDHIVPAYTPAGRPIRGQFEFGMAAELMRLVSSGAAMHLTVLSAVDVAPPTVQVLPVWDLPPVTIHLAHLATAPRRIHDLATAAESAMTARAG